MVPGHRSGVTVHPPAANRRRSTTRPCATKKKSAADRRGGGGVRYRQAREWAAKGPRLLGVRAVSRTASSAPSQQLVGMGCCRASLPRHHGPRTLKLDGTERSIASDSDDAKPGQSLTLVINRKDGVADRVSVTLRLDTPAEIEYVRHGGIMPYVLAEITRAKAAVSA